MNTKEDYIKKISDLEDASMSHGMKQTSSGFFIKRISEDKPVMSVYAMIDNYSSPDRIIYRVGYSASCLQYQERNKVEEMKFDDAQEAVSFIIKRAERINSFFENL